MFEGKKLVAYYLATEPHIMKASGVPEDLIQRVQSVMGWPATEAEYLAAAKVIPDDVVRSLMAVGTSDECVAKVQEYIDAGVTCPILYPMMDDIKPVVDAFAEAYSL
jgi:5,10-methylenetetrahydromethanopterin reductase